MALLTQGDIAVDLGDYDSARTFIHESLALSREAGDAFRTGFAYNVLGDLAWREGNYAEAKTQYENCVALLRQLGDQHNLASIIRNQGRACLLLGESRRAAELFNESLRMHQAEQNTKGMVECLIGLGSTAVVQGLPAAGARLLAAAMVLRGEHSVYVWPVKPMQIDPYLELAHARLSEAEFQAEQAAGRAMSLEQAIDYAQKLLLIPEVASKTGVKPGDLTGREREVAALIGQGKTNGEIAGELVLSKRTVETHINHILSKLGLTSRAQIIRWALDQGLTKDHIR